MRVVDGETRKEFRNKRLASLEADNYMEEILQDDAYSDDENEKECKKTKAMPKQTGATGNIYKKWFGRKIKSLERMVDELQYSISNNGTNEPNYIFAAASSSKNPERHFCSVCGYFGNYSCIRCGSRFCSRKCNENHKETRCLKFSL